MTKKERRVVIVRTRSIDMIAAVDRGGNHKS